MQFNFRFLSVLALATLTTITACKKDDVIKQQTSNEVKDQVDEQNRVSADLDAVAEDINTAIESEVTFSGRGENMESICGSTTVLDTTSNPRTITVTFNGLNCSGTYFRTGIMKLSMAAGTHWKDAGASFTVTFTNVKMKRVSDNKSITINGTQTHTNVSGGLWYQIPTQTLIHTVNSNNMGIKFDDNTLISWSIAKKNVYTYDNGIVCTVYGTHVDGTNEQVAEWGTTRFNQTFKTSITTPVQIRQSCNFRITAGEIRHEGFATATITFGLDAAGATVSTCPGGVYYYKIIWTGPAGISVTVIAPY